MSEIYTYIPQGVCSKKYTFEIEDNVIKKVDIKGGCLGNLLGISKIIVGMTIDEVVEDFEGTMCGRKPTSCPDQIAKALKSYQQEHMD